jgi:hypothetical protein
MFHESMIGLVIGLLIDPWRFKQFLNGLLFCKFFINEGG